MFKNNGELVLSQPRPFEGAGFVSINTKMWGPRTPFPTVLMIYLSMYVSYQNMKMFKKTNVFHPKTNGNFFFLLIFQNLFKTQYTRDTMPTIICKGMEFENLKSLGE